MMGGHSNATLKRRLLCLAFGHTWWDDVGGPEPVCLYCVERRDGGVYTGPPAITVAGLVAALAGLGVVWCHVRENSE